MNASIKRSVVRTFHLIGAAIIGTYVYSPWEGTGMVFIVKPGSSSPRISCIRSLDVAGTKMAHLDKQ